MDFIIFLLYLLFHHSLAADVFLLRSPFLTRNTTMGQQHAVPIISGYPPECLAAIDIIYNSHSYTEFNLEGVLTYFCTDVCLEPLEGYWKGKIMESMMVTYHRSILCQKTGRGFCLQQFAQSSSWGITEEVDYNCINRWCPLICDSYRHTDHQEHLRCCGAALANQTFPMEKETELYGMTRRGLGLLQSREEKSYEYCSTLLSRFENDGKCLNVHELVHFIHSLVHCDEHLQNTHANRHILKEALHHYCPHCLQIVTSYYTACASSDQALHEIFLYKALYCSHHHHHDYCIVKGLHAIADGHVSHHKFNMYCKATDRFCPREKCRDVVHHAKKALDCCCQNLFNIDGSPFRDLIPDFIVRFMECHMELPKMCGGAGHIRTLFPAVMTAAVLNIILVLWLMA